jgi:hypothetical protein
MEHMPMTTKHVSLGLLIIALTIQASREAFPGEPESSSLTLVRPEKPDVVFAVALSPPDASSPSPAAPTDSPPPVPPRPATPGASPSPAPSRPAPQTSPLTTPWNGSGNGGNKACGCGDSCGCDRNCCNLCPCVYGYAEALFMQRSHGDPDRDILFDSSTNQSALNSRDLNFNYSPGVRAVVGFCYDGWLPLELGYFGLFDSKASATVTSADTGDPFFGNLTFPGDLGAASNVFAGAQQVSVDYTSEIHSGEINYHCCCCCNKCCCSCPQSFEWLAGFRYLSLREKLFINGQRNEVGGVETANYDLWTSNDLYGGQLGARWRVCHGGWSWEATAKGGIFANSENEKQQFIDFPNFPLRPLVSGSGSTTAFVGELNLTGIYQINDVWGIRAGYNLMWIEGVALAPDQLDFSFTSTSGSQIERNGGIFLQGANVGLEARW